MIAACSAALGAGGSCTFGLILACNSASFFLRSTCDFLTLSCCCLSCLLYSFFCSAGVMDAFLMSSLGSAAGLAVFGAATAGVAVSPGAPVGLARTSLPLSISLSLPGLLMLTSLEPSTPGLAAAGGTLAGIVGR